LLLITANMMRIHWKRTDDRLFYLSVVAPAQAVL
jgi:hypothetical protein